MGARRQQALWAVVVISLLAGASAVSADVYNGDFEAGPPLDGWSISPDDPPDSYVEAVAEPGPNTVARLHAETTYTYTGGQWVGQLQQAYIQQFGIALEPGQTQLAFDGMALEQGLEVVDPTVSVVAVGGGGGGCAVASDQWTHYVVPLLGPGGEPLAPGTVINLIVEVGTSAPISAGQEGQQVEQVVDLYVDNFRLVPAPSTALVVLGGVALLLGHRRRR